MTEATWDDAAKDPPIDWRMSAALENVPRGDSDVAEVTSLEGAIRAWVALDANHQGAALLTLEHPVQIAGAAVQSFSGEAITALAERLPRPTATS